MTEYKTQHFLPFSYLKHFRCDPNVSSREDATIYRDDGKTCCEEKVKNQCCGKWFYTRTDADLSEADFQSLEGEWSDVLEKLRQGVPYDGAAITQLISLNLRSSAMQMNMDSKNRYEAVRDGTRSLLGQKILELPVGTDFLALPKGFMQIDWEAQLVKFPSPILLTTDNPAVMTITPMDRGYGPFFVAVNPSELLVIVDMRKYKFRTKLATVTDGFVANAYAVCQRVRHLYHHREPVAKDRAVLWRLVRKYGLAPSQMGSFENERLMPTHQIYARHPGWKFDFLEAR